MYLLNLNELAKYFSAEHVESYNKITAELKELFRKEMELTRSVGNYNENAVRKAVEAKINAAQGKYGQDPSPKNQKALEQASESLHGELEKAKQMREQIRQLREKNHKEINTLFENQVVPLLKIATEAALTESRNKDAEEAAKWGIATSESAVTKALTNFRERAHKTSLPARERYAVGGTSLNGYQFAKCL